MMDRKRQWWKRRRGKWWSRSQGWRMQTHSFNE